MNYCSLEDAFQISSGGQQARKEERKKARKCRGPQLTFLEGTDQSIVATTKDPDRQQLDPPASVPAMNKATGIKVHKPTSQAWNWWSTPERVLGQGEMEAFQDAEGTGAGSGTGIENEVADQRLAELLPRTDDDPTGDAVRATLPTPQMLAAATASAGSANPKNGSKKSYFGADPTDDNFADYKPLARNFLMEPNFTQQFAHANAGSGPISPQADAGPRFTQELPSPSVRDVWKPLSSSIPAPSFDTAFYNSLPPTGGMYPKDETPYQSLSQKIDRIMDRLDAIGKPSVSGEQSQLEVLMFVSSGVFVLFLMDLLVKKGAMMKF
jgi:hypothetical protein